MVTRRGRDSRSGTAATAAPWWGNDLPAAEVRYLIRCAWARTADDVLWRRSKLGPRLTAEQAAAPARFIGSISAAGAAVRS